MKYLVKFFFFAFVFLLSISKTFSQQKAGEASPCSDFPSLVFKDKVAVLTPDNKKILKLVVAKLNESAETNLMVRGNSDDSKHSQLICSSRLAAIKRYVNETLGISSNRIVLNIANGDLNTVDLSCFLKE